LPAPPARMARQVQDHYFRQAKREGYLSRAAYKLIEIDDRKKLLSKGDRVLDCGAAPGSWLQVAARRVGPKGEVVGIDLKPIGHTIDALNIRTIEGDLTSAEPEALLGEGLTNRLIARRLGVAEKTVKTHVSAVLSKLDLSDRTQAALLAVREGLDLAKCSAYSDSANDVPLLSMVGSPYAVNPDRKLRAHAGAFEEVGLGGVSPQHMGTGSGGVVRAVTAERGDDQRDGPHL
jgi:23S rRNA U2552 (ribose-2'-O)-methylase RlmE/FtsJ